MTPQTLTTMAIADGVAAEIQTPADATVWSQSGFRCRRSWLPTPSAEEQKTLQVDVIALGRVRVPKAGIVPTPGRETRGLLRSGHRIKVQMQKAISTAPATYDAELDALAAFLMQVDDYWNAAHRKVAAIPGIIGDPHVTLMESSLVIYEPRKVDTQALWAGEILLTFTEATAW